MIKLKVVEFGAWMESVFLQPVPFSDAVVSNFVADAFKHFQVFGITHEHLTKFEGDRFFHYELRLRLFNGNFVMKRRAEGIDTWIRGGVQKSDYELLFDLLNRTSQSASEERKTLLNCYLHASLDGSTVEDYLRRFSPMQPLRVEEVTLSLPEASLTSAGRLSISQSNIAQNGVFLVWKFPVAGQWGAETRQCIEECVKESLATAEFELVP